MNCCHFVIQSRIDISFDGQQFVIKSMFDHLFIFLNYGFQMFKRSVFGFLLMMLFEQPKFCQMCGKFLKHKFTSNPCSGSAELFPAFAQTPVAKQKNYCQNIVLTRSIAK